MFDFDGAAKLLGAELDAISGETKMLKARLAFALKAAEKLNARLETAGQPEEGRHELHS
jgi:hypothetical protein